MAKKAEVFAGSEQISFNDQTKAGQFICYAIAQFEQLNDCTIHFEHFEHYRMSVNVDRISIAIFNDTHNLIAFHKLGSVSVFNTLGELIELIKQYFTMVK